MFQIATSACSGSIQVRENKSARRLQFVEHIQLQNFLQLCRCQSEFDDFDIAGIVIKFRFRRYQNRQIPIGNDKAANTCVCMHWSSICSTTEVEDACTVQFYLIWFRSRSTIAFVGVASNRIIIEAYAQILI